MDSGADYVRAADESGPFVPSGEMDLEKGSPSGINILDMTDGRYGDLWDGKMPLFQLPRFNVRGARYTDLIEASPSVYMAGCNLDSVACHAHLRAISETFGSCQGRVSIF